MKEYQEKALGELKDQKRLLIKEVKLLRKKTVQTESINASFLQEFEALHNIMQRTKEASQNND